MNSHAHTHDRKKYELSHTHMKTKIFKYTKCQYILKYTVFSTHRLITACSVVGTSGTWYNWYIAGSQLISGSFLMTSVKRMSPYQPYLKAYT